MKVYNALALLRGRKVGTGELLLLIPRCLSKETLDGAQIGQAIKDFERAIAVWQGLPSDHDAEFDTEVSLDASAGVSAGADSAGADVATLLPRQRRDDGLPRWIRLEVFLQPRMPEENEPLVGPGLK